MLYQRPQNEFVATFLGTANLLVGESAYGGIQVGPQHFSLNSHTTPIEEGQRVQVLFRPEDVALSATNQELDCPPLGHGIIENIVFSGAFQRLRLRLPALPGVRPIAPAPAYGDDTILVEVTRTQDQVSRLPLQPQQSVWVGLHRIHALAHPGLRFLIVTDGSPLAEAALTYGGHLARLTHARVTLLGYGADEDSLQAHLQVCKEKLGSGLAALDLRTSGEELAVAVAQEIEQQPVDMVIMGFKPDPHHIHLAEEVLGGNEHHLLLVPQMRPIPTHALVCVSSGEPAKEDVRFTARLIRHVGAEANLLAVIPPRQQDELSQQRVQRFLDGGVKTLELLGVPAETTIRTGSVSQEIKQELASGAYDLLVLGSPLPDRVGEISLDGIISQVITAVPQLPTLIVRSARAERGEPLLRTANGYPYLLQEVF